MKVKEFTIKLKNARIDDLVVLVVFFASFSSITERRKERERKGERGSNII